MHSVADWLANLLNLFEFIPHHLGRFVLDLCILLRLQYVKSSHEAAVGDLP